MKKINLEESFTKLQECWKPAILGEINDSYVKLAKLDGEFVWHHHEIEDEFFFVVKGTLRMQFREEVLVLQEGECVIVPHGVEHKPIADTEVHVLLFEPKTTINTGNIHCDRTVGKLERLS